MPDSFEPAVLTAFHRSAVCLLLTLLIPSSCQRSTLDRPIGRVEGIVRYDGQPLEGAQVVFRPPDYRPSVGVTDAQGHYDLQFTQTVRGAVVGDHQVRITTQRFATGGEGGAPAISERAEFLPPRFHENTELTATVRKGKNEINFDLSSKTP